jgi:cytochrome oxidase Cu insertion factor (SCO1/SenC/PrrC family)
MSTMWGLPRYRILMVIILLIAAVLAGEWMYLSSRPDAPIKVIPMQKKDAVAKAPGRPFTLTDHRGQTFDSSKQEQNRMLLVFGYTYCPDVCPTTLQNIVKAIDQLPADAQDVLPIMITVDPARDSSNVLAEYVAAFHPKMVGLTGSSDEIKSLTRDFRVFVSKAPGEDDYLIDHSIFVYLVDGEGNTLNYFPGTLPADKILEQLVPYLGPTPKTAPHRS